MIELLPTIQYLLDTLIIPVIATFALGLLYKHTGMVKEEKHAKALSEGLRNGADLILARLENQGKLSLEIGSPAVTQLVQYGLDHMPDAIQHFKKANPEMNLQNLAASRLAMAAKGNKTT